MHAELVYVVVVCNLFMLLFLYLVVRPSYEAKLTKKIRADVLKNVSAALDNLRINFNSKLTHDILKAKMDMRQENAVGRIVQSTMIQKRERDE